MEKVGVSLRFEFSLFIEEEYDVSQITDILGIQPTKTHRKSEQFRENRYYKESAWALWSEKVFSYFLEEEMLKFIKSFENSLPAIRKLMQRDRLRCVMSVLLEIVEGQTMPAVGFEASTINLLSSFNRSVDIDMYDYR